MLEDAKFSEIYRRLPGERKYHDNILQQASTHSLAPSIVESFFLRGAICLDTHTNIVHAGASNQDYHHEERTAGLGSARNGIGREISCFGKDVLDRADNGVRQRVGVEVYHRRDEVSLADDLVCSSKRSERE